MEFECVKTGSKGNSYILADSDKNILLLDLGVPKLDIIRAIDYKSSCIVGAIVSHSHLDHSKSGKDFENMGIPVFRPYLNKRHIQKAKLGSFKIKSFDLPHDGTENRGFLIEVDGQKVLYMTDFEYCRYNFKKSKINHILIECNYQKEYAESGSANFEHKVKGHSSLDYVRKFILDNKTDSLMNVILLHRGISTTDPEECIVEVQKVVGAGINVYMAKAGLEVELKDTPF